MKKYKIEIKWAIMFALMTILWMALERLVGLHDRFISYHAVLTNLYAIPAIMVYIFALLDKRKNYFNNSMTYMQGFITGVIITIIITILTPLTQFITLKIITPIYFPNIIAYVVENGQMTQLAAEKYFSMKSYIIQSIIAAPLMGLVTSALVSIFVRNEKK